MLNQATGQNVANTAALQAGQRGASGNVGQMARTIGQTGAQTQQTAAGQAATLQANQSLNAIGQAGGIAGTQAANQVGQVNANSAAQQAEQSQLLGAQANFNAAQAGMQGNINSANAGLAQSQMGMTGSVLGGAASGIAAGLLLAAKGGMVKKMASGGDASAFSGSGAQSKFGQFLISNQSVMNPQMSGAPAPIQPDPNLAKGAKSGAQALTKALMSSSPSDGGPDPFNGPNSPDVGDLPQAGTPGMHLNPDAFAKGGKVKALVSPGERFLKPSDVKAVAKGQKSPLKAGEKIPGKPKFPGNDYRNDTVPKNLEEGGIVIPNKVLQSKNPGHEAKKFVDAVLAKRKTR